MAQQLILNNGKKNDIILNKPTLKLSQQNATNEEKMKYLQVNAQQQATQNNGGLLGGIGYTLEKLGLGFLQSIEGIWDYTAGGLAKLFGADDWAEQQFANDWVDYGHADEWFNPDDGWRMAGDVAGGIGTSLPAMGTVAIAGAIAVASGGSLTPLAAALISGTVAGLGAAGTATKEAYRQTGELGGKEFGYGALSGITEGAVEGLSAGIGAGTGAIVQRMSKSFGKEVAQSAARETFGKAIVKGFLGEAFEEGVSEMLDPVWQRLTYNPDAENATIQEIGYAALIGGLSGAIMGGVDVSIRNGVNARRGSKITTQGKVDSVIGLAEQISEYETTNQTGYEQFEIVNSTLTELKESLQKTGGEVKTVKQKMLLGYLQQANTSAVFTPTMAKSTENIVNNAEVIAERLTAYGYKDTSGKPITFTAEQIRQGFDITQPKTFAKTLKENDILRGLVVADTTGHLLMDTSKYRDATLAGKQLSGQVDLNRFIEQSTDSEKAAVAEKLGISDWNTLTVEELNQKITEFTQNQGIDEARTFNASKREMEQLDAATVKPLPRTITMQKDGAVRYSIGDTSVGVIKNGDTFKLYDYQAGTMSKPLTRAELNKVLRDIHSKAEATVKSRTTTVEQQNGTDTQIVEETEYARQARELDTYCRENIKDYAKLGDANQSMVRMGLRLCREAGISEQWSLTYARVSARTGLNIVVNKEMCFVNANGTYADGAIDLQNNRIIINPETKTRTGEMVLIHELTHAIYNSHDGVLTVAQGVETMTDAEREKIRKRYSAVGRGSAIEVADEINAHYAEQTLTNINVFERLLQEKPTLKQRVLSFFLKSKSDYSNDSRLSGAAQKLYKQYKKLFDDFANGTRKSSGNQFRNASETTTAMQKLSSQTGIHFAQSIENYPYNMQEVIGEYIDSVDSTIQEHAELYIADKNNQQFVRDKICDVSSKMAEIIKSEVDVDVTGATININKNGYNHIAMRHGKNGTHDHSMADVRDIARIGYVIENCDSLVALKDQNGQQIYSTEYKDSNNNPAPLVLFGKKINGTYYCSVAAVDSQVKKLWVETAYINKKGLTYASNALQALDSTSKTEHSYRPFDKQSTSLLTDEQAPSPTSKTEQRLKTVSTDSISKNGEKVNTNGKNNTNKRYALQIGDETAQVEVEKTKNLVALHNLSDQNLMKVLKLGGFAMPSIAITKTDIPFTDFGDITVIFGKETIDPANPDNVVYERDAWTPTIPRAEYKLNETKAQEIIKRLTPYADEYGGADSLIRRFLTADAIEDLLIHNDGDLVNHFAYYYETKYAFLKETGVVSERISKSEIDTEITAHSKEYKAWLDEMFANVAEKKGVRNNVELHEQSGAKRSFEATHYDYTLENIVKVMREAQAQGDADSYASTATLAAALAKNFSSIEDMKQAESMLVAKNRKEMSTFRNEWEKAISEIVDSMADRSIIAQQGAEEVLLELARAKRTTAGAILVHLQKEYNGVYKFNVQTAQKISTLFNALSQMKTDMFEAKPRRAVALSEIKQVLIPSRKPNQELLQELDKKGIPYTLYQHSINNDIDERAQIIREMDGIRFALPDVEQDAVDTFGITYKWSETGYLLVDGSRLDFSGKKQGANGGSRTVDHREIQYVDYYDKSDIERVDAMVDFMQRGNIRIAPEYPAINLSVAPTQAQERALGDYISYNHGEVTLDIDNAKGTTVVSVDYPCGTYYTKVIQDIRNYFKDGTKPVVSDLSKFRYALEETSESKRSKPIDGQMDIFRDILGVEYEEAFENWDSNYTKLATKNADSVIQKLKERGYENSQVYGDGRSEGRGHSGTSDNGQGRGVYDFNTIRRIFEKRGKKTVEENRIYNQVVRTLRGYSIQSPNPTSAWQFGAIDESFYTYEMARTAAINAKNGVKTVFYLDQEIYKGGRRQYSTAGLYIHGANSVYVSAIQEDYSRGIPFETKVTPAWGGKPTYRFDYLSARTDASKVAATRELNESRAVMRHERLHLLYNNDSRSTSNYSNETYSAIRALKQFVEERFAGRTDDVHRSIKNYYVKELGYGKVETAIEEIACDLYAEELILRDDAERAEVKKLIDSIDKSLNDIVGKDGVRYALPDDDTKRGGLTKGQRAKFVANNTKFKVYSRAEAESVINSIIDERLNIDDKVGSLSGKTREQAIDTLFTKLNNTHKDYRLGVALHLADYIIDNAVLTDMYETYDTDDSFLMDRLAGLRSVMHKFNLDGIRDEIKYRYDNKAGAIYRLWGAKTGGRTADVIMRDTLIEYGITTDAINEADIFFEIVDAYESTRDSLKKKVETLKLSAYGSAAKIEKLKQQIARDILLAYDEKGSQSKYAKLIEKYTNQIDSLRNQVRNARKINALTNSIVETAGYLRDVATKRKYVGAEVFNAPELTSWLQSLGKLKYRANMRQSGAREILLNYGKFYNTGNALLYDSTPELNYIDQNVLDALDLIKANESSTKPLSLEELQAAQVILQSAKHLFQNYDQITIDGKKQRITDVANAEMEILKDSANHTGRGFAARIYGVLNKIVEPRVVIKSIENYNPNGILTKAWQDITNGETAADAMYMGMMADFDDFFKVNKKYSKRLTTEYITVAGKKLTVGQAITLYELSKRPQAKDGLYSAGVSYINEKGVKTDLRVVENDITQLENSFTSTDKQFIAIVEQFFNVTSKQIKTQADLDTLGYTNASDEFYFPIKRDEDTVARNVTDARTFAKDMANVYNFSFNKDVKAGAKTQMFIGDVFSVVTNHASQLSKYANLTVPLKNFAQIYAKNVGTKTEIKSIKSELSRNVWGGADAYLKKLFADIQGTRTSNSVVEKIRSGYAKYQLGANAKVIVSQVTSFPTGGILLDTSSMAKALVMKTNYAAMDKYCPYARVRNYEKGIVKAEGVIDKVGKVGDFLTKPIQWTDRGTIGKLWNACQAQVQKDSGHKIGTEANMKEAGVLLEEVVRLTQPNYTNTERSELMRSDSDIVRSFTMFTSVPLKQLSRLVESFGEYNALKKLVKTSKDPTIQSRYKLAKRKLGRTLGAITIANLMYVMVGQFFKWLYNKDRTDKDGNEISFLQDLLNDFVGTSIGMFPIVKDIYAFFANDYEISSFWADSLNGILESTQELFDMATKAASGEPMETNDFMRPLRNSLYAIGQLTGLPIRNINNTIIGLVRRFSPSTAYKYDSMFYNAQYSKDIKNALAKGDYELAESIMSMLLDEDKAGDLNSEARKKLMELYAKEYTVLPKTVGDKITYDGQEIALTSKERKRFKEVYGQANSFIEQMVKNDTFKSLSESMQAKAIKQVYDAYYDKAMQEVLSVETDNKLLLVSSAIKMDKLSPVLAGMSEITTDQDKDGNVIANSKKKKTIQYLLQQKNLSNGERLLLLYCKGYTIKDKEYRSYSAKKARSILLRYILRLNTSKEQRIQLAEMCGFEVQNGRILAKSI